MKIMNSLLAGSAATLFLVTAHPAFASPVVYALNIISAANIGTGTQGLVTLTEDSIDPTHKINVEVDLSPGVLLVNSGGPHTPFTFNLASPVAGSTVTVTSTNVPATFFADTGSQDATPYGTFTNGIGYNGSNGGVGHGSAGPLTFSVFNSSGLTISDFITNNLGYFFAADLYGTGGHTGSVAANAVVSPVPLPAALPLFAAGLSAMGLMSRRKKRKIVVAG